MLKEIIKNAKSAALRDGYDQAIIQEKDGDFSFCRNYPGCCPDWQGKIIKIVVFHYERGVAKVFLKNA